jgi:polysaccharide biosynthesis/export protein
MQREQRHIQRKLGQRARMGLMSAALSGLVAACASGTAGAIPIDKLPPEPPSQEYVIAVGDSLNVQVFEQEKMSGQHRVRTDGRITIPLLNDMEAAGKTPPQFQAELETALKKLIITPQVTVTVLESRPLEISLIGEVNKPGPLQLQRGSGLAQALAAAGGLTTFADRDKIFVIRGTQRIHVTYDAITRAVGRAATFQLRTGDVINVE